MTGTDPVIISPNLKVIESRFLLLTELGSDRMMGEMNSQESIPHQIHTHEQFTLRNLLAFVNMASRFFKTRCGRIDPVLSWVTSRWDGIVQGRNRLSISASGESLSSRVLSRPTHSHLEMPWTFGIISIRLTMMSASRKLLESEDLTIHELLESQRRAIFASPILKFHNRIQKRSFSVSS
jgi:hypothetical protein